MSSLQMVLDCDPGIDDALAIILGLKAPEINLLGISVCAGNTTVDQAYNNADRILRLLERDVPLVKGASGPLVKEPVFAHETHGQDGFGLIAETFDAVYPKRSRPDENKDLIEYYKELMDSHEDICLVCLGPLTNIAILLQHSRQSLKSVSRIVSMGGAYKSHGNSSPVAEFNYWFDPEAADYVYKNAPCPIEMVGLDVTREILLDKARLQQVKKSSGEKIGNFIEDITAFYMDFHKTFEGLEGCVINDPLAVACTLDPSLLDGFSSFVEVVSDGIARGASVVDAHDFYGKAPNAHVYTKVNAERFFELFCEKLRGGL